MDWLTPELSDALAAIADPHAAKKQTTVLLLAQAVAVGSSLTAIFDLPDTCKADVWYGLNRRGRRKPGWKDDPAIATALSLATARARWWVRVKQGHAVQNSLDILTDGAEAAARQLVNMVQMGVLIFDFGADGMELRRADNGHILEASKQILDRVSASTAAKNVTTHAMDADQFSALSLKAKAAAQAVADDAAQAWNPEQKPEDADDPIAPLQPTDE